MEFSQLFERVFANNVGVEDEEWRVILAEDLFCQFQGTGGTQGFGLDGEFDVDIVLFFVLLKKTG